MVVTLFWTVLGTAGALPLYISTQRPSASPMRSSRRYRVSPLRAPRCCRTRRAAALDPLLPPAAAVAGRHGHRDPRGGAAADARRRRMSLYRAEMPGPVKDTKLAPRITQSARMLWIVYVTITAACAAGYALAGMSPFDAIGHAFATVCDRRLLALRREPRPFRQPDGRTRCGVLHAGRGRELRSALHRLAQRRLGAYWRDPECAAFLRLMLGLSMVTLIYLLVAGDYEDTLQLAADGVFQAVSIATTTASRLRTTTTGRPGSRSCYCSRRSSAAVRVRRRADSRWCAACCS